VPPQCHDVRRAELDGLAIRRALPVRQRRMVGAWCFLDHIGPVPADGPPMRVGAHSHIGLQTFTWMIAGEILHRDSLGSEQVIRPGQVNLMTAGRGVSHTEDSVDGSGPLHAAQLWIALPPALAGCAPAFEHHPSLPAWSAHGARFTLLVGQFDGHAAPTRVHSPLLGLDLLAERETELVMPLAPGFEHGLLPLEGSARVDGSELAPDTFAWLAPGRDRVRLALAAGARLLLLGGEPFATPVTMWWNFVGFSRDEIVRADRDWAAGHARFGSVRGGEGRRVPAPPLPWAGRAG